MTGGEGPVYRHPDHHSRIPAWVWRTLLGLVIMLIIIALAEGGTIHKIGIASFSVTFSSGTRGGASPNPSLTGSSAAHSTSRANHRGPVRTTVGYLYTMVPSAGGPVQRGVTSFGGRTFKHSIWLPFQVYCCGTEQSVTYQIPGGYRYLEAFLGQSPLHGDQNGYTMMFSISINGVTMINGRQALLGDPPIPIKVRLPTSPSTVLIDVTTSCPFLCAGDAVIGNARLVPPRG
jgi:hypothetical protein